VAVVDTFTDTDATLLDAHTPESGTWTKHAASNNNLQIASNRVRASSNTEGMYYHSYDHASAEYEIEADFTWVGGTVEAFYLMARMDVTGGTVEDRYAFGYNAGSTRWQIDVVNAGVFTVLNTSADTLTVTQTYHLRVVCTDAAKTLYVDGVQKCTTATNALTPAGKAGLRLFGATNPMTNSIGVHADNFELPEVTTAQLAYAASTISAGSWTAVGAATIHEAIDETTASDAEYAQSDLSPVSASAVRVKFGTLTDPVSSDDHIVRYRLGKDSAGGHTIQVTAKLYQGSTLISTDPSTRTVPDSFTDYEWELSGAEADNITDYTDLRLDISAIKA
jgi:hypothetical protein